MSFFSRKPIQYSRVVWILIFGIAGSFTAFSSEPQMIQMDTQLEFINGDLNGVSVDPDGHIYLGWKSSRLAEFNTESFIWTLVQGPGQRLYAGTGNDGKIFEISANKESKLLFDSPEITILCLISDKNGNLYAGTAPDGLIYKIPQKGTPQVWARTETHYVWDLQITPNGKIAVATGGDAKILIIDKSGSIETEFPIKATHVRCLISTDSGIWAGTVNPGSIFRIQHSDLQLFYESQAIEISSIVQADDKMIYFSTVSSSTITNPEITAAEAIQPNYSTDDGQNVRSRIYRISPNGTLDTYWSTKATPIFDMIIHDNKPLVACGIKGLIFQVISPGKATLLTSVNQEPVLSLSKLGEEIAMGTANVPEVLILEKKSVDEGTYTSEIYDASSTAQWGIFSSISESQEIKHLEIETRSGNQKDPDDLWSDWVPLKIEEIQSRIQSPPARFIQWRIHLKKNSQHPTGIDGVVFSLLKPNRPPVMLKIKVYPVTKGTFVEQPGGSGKVFRQNFMDGTVANYILAGKFHQNGIPKGVFLKLQGMRSVQWKCKDPDNDSLTYDVFISPSTQEHWTSLAKEIETPIFSFDSAVFPDGMYQIKITASDSPSNPKGQEQMDSAKSKVFIIDNTPPQILEFKIEPLKNKPQAIRVFGQTADESSRISQIELSFDTDRWFKIAGSDGILDSKRENFDITINREKDANQVFLRVTDANENVQSSSILFN